MSSTMREQHAAKLDVPAQTVQTQAAEAGSEVPPRMVNNKRKGVPIQKEPSEKRMMVQTGAEKADLLVAMALPRSMQEDQNAQNTSGGQPPLELPAQDGESPVSITSNGSIPTQEEKIPNESHTPNNKDYNLCVRSYNTNSHEHKMVESGLDYESNSQGESQSKSPQESRRQGIQQCIQSLVHACQCRNDDCSRPGCQMIKRVVQHTKKCKRKTNGGCPVCKHLIALCCYHAKHCQENKCPVLFCLKVKQKIQEQQIQHRLQQAQVFPGRMVLPGFPSPG